MVWKFVKAFKVTLLYPELSRGSVLFKGILTGA